MKLNEVIKMHELTVQFVIDSVQPLPAQLHWCSDDCHLLLHIFGSRKGDHWEN